VTAIDPEDFIASCVLVSLTASGAEQAHFLGRTTAERQVEFAAACGCTTVILLGGGGSPEAIATRHLAEGLGLSVREVSGPHALARAGLAGERLLVLQGDLLPDPTALPTGSDIGSAHILTLAAGPGVEAGFERIDLSRAWAGLLVLPGALLARLLDLPEDAEAASALLRIGLQAGLAERQLALAHLDDGTWCLASDLSQGNLAEEKWLARHLTPAGGDPLSRQLAQVLLRHLGGAMLDRPWARPLALGLALMLPLAGIALCQWGQAALGFLVLALTAPLLELALGLGRLQRARAGHFGGADSKLAHLRKALDLALLVAGVLAVSGTLLERSFAPLVLLAAFHGVSPKGPPRLTRWRDRGLAAALVAVGAVALSPQAGLMLAALAMLALNLLQTQRRGG
jgi:hypothetical protein